MNAEMLGRPASESDAQSTSESASAGSSQTSGVRDVDRGSLFFEMLVAVERDHDEVVESLLKFMCVLEVVQLDPREGLSSYGLSPLHMARSPTVADLLVTAGVPVDIEGNCGATPLATCSRYGDVVAHLIKLGADVHHVLDDGTTALHHAVITDSVDTARVLIDRGADVSKADQNLNTCMHMVNSVEMAELLVESGAEITTPNKMGRIALEEAAARGDNSRSLAVANFLLELSHEAQRSRAKQLLNVLQQHVWENFAHADKLESDADQRVFPVKVQVGQGSEEEEKMFYDELPEEHCDSKWTKVKENVLRGKLKMMRIRRQRADPGYVRSVLASSRRARFAARSGSLQEAEQAANVEFYASFFELMVRQRPELAMKILDKQRKLLNEAHGCKSYAYDMALVGTPLRTTAAVKQMVRLRRYDLLSHPVVQWSQTIKFITFTRYFLFYEFMLNNLFGLLVIASHCKVDGENGLKPWFWTVFSGEVFRDPSENNLIRTVMVVVEVLMHLINLRYMLSFMVVWKASCKKVKTNWDKMRLLAWGNDVIAGDWQLIPHLLLVFRDYLRFFHWNSSSAGGERMSHEWASVITSACFLVISARSLEYAEGLYENLGLTTAMLKQMFADARSYFQVLALLVVGFSIVMTILYQDFDSGLDPDFGFGSFIDSFATLFFFVFDLNLDAIKSDPVGLRKTVALGFLAIYMVFVVLTLVNLIVAVFTNSYEEVKVLAKEQNLLTRAKYVIRFEEQIALLEPLLNAFRRKDASRCVFRSSWREWEKEEFARRKEPVREFPDGKVVIAVRRSMMQFVLRQKTPPSFLWLVGFYDALSWVAPTSFAHSLFSWRELAASAWARKEGINSNGDLDERTKLLGRQMTTTRTFAEFNDEDNADDPVLLIGFFMRSRKFDLRSLNEDHDDLNAADKRACDAYQAVVHRARKALRRAETSSNFSTTPTPPRPSPSRTSSTVKHVGFESATEAQQGPA